MGNTLHDMRNDLAVATALLHAFIDGLLEPNQTHLKEALASLEQLDAKISEAGAESREGVLSAKEELLEAIVEGSPYAKILVDESGLIVLVNAQTEKLFGYARDELLGQSVDLLVPMRFRLEHPALREVFNIAPIARPMGAGRDLYGRRKDETEVPIEIGLVPVATEMGMYTLAAITDITERKRAEELRLRHAGVEQHARELEILNRELASASRFKTQFISTMSHELRTPLAAIIGASELLESTALAERESVSVRTIGEAAEALFSLINSILDFSKIEAGKMELQLSRIEIDKVVDGAVELVAQLARQKGLTLHTYVDPTIPPVRGDGDRLRQILLNLLGNAVKFTECGSVVGRVVPIETRGAGIVLRFEITDTGIGIAPEVVPTLFEPFAQGDNTASRKFAGSGLGLSISKRLVELMGGKIGLETQAGAGSLFWFTLPFELATGPAASPRRMLDGVAGLIVSGDDTFCEIIERYMASWAMNAWRAMGRSDIANALQSDATLSWIAIVDVDDVAPRDSDLTLASVRALLPERVVGVGKGGLLAKPVRQSELFDAIARLVDVASVEPGRPKAAAAQHLTAPLRVGRVLVAEDDARLQRLLKLQLDELGAQVTFVSDGAAALEALRLERYALVFMDCQMPTMDGLAATRLIRQEERESGRHVPIVAMTANAFAEDRELCLAAGMDDYLSKPVKLAALRAAIEQWAKPERRDGSA